MMRIGPVSRHGIDKWLLNAGHDHSGSNVFAFIDFGDKVRPKRSALIAARTLFRPWNGNEVISVSSVTCRPTIDSVEQVGAVCGQ